MSSDRGGVGVDVHGTDGRGWLRVSAEVASGAFHLPADWVDGVVDLLLRPGSALDVPPDLTPAAAAAWLVADPDRAQADRWFAASVSRDGERADTLWATVDPAVDHAPGEILAQAAGYVRDSTSDSADPALLREVLDSAFPAAPADEPLSRLRKVLLSGGADPQELEPGGGTIGFQMGTDQAVWDCLVEVTDDWLVLYAQLPVEIVDSADGFELTAQINRELQVGCLLSDDEGTVLYRAATDSTGTSAAFRRLVERAHREVAACLATLAEGQQS